MLLFKKKKGGGGVKDFNPLPQLFSVWGMKGKQKGGK